MLRRRCAATAAVVSRPAVAKSDDEWRADLTPAQYRVLRRSGTERAFSGEYWNCHDDGTYHCAACDAPLFTSQSKFDSGTGWPSFTEPAVAEAVTMHGDRRMLIRRTEVRCRCCGSHLGHVFPDGSGPTRDRFCINSCSLRLRPATGATGDTGTRGTSGATTGATGAADASGEGSATG
ncbi:MAG: protein-methionine-S-oxide reductase [Ilumatobacteraceae bacterium]|nr:protein-methionine-S-oxide reductase [Ilumatobacteraceae bacterium]